MNRILILSLIATGLLWSLYLTFKDPFSKKSPQEREKPKRLRPLLNPRELWVQVYDTDSLEEARRIQARLEEEEVDCFVYEQGKKDVHGNPLKSYGLACPRTSVSLAQKILSRIVV